MTPAPCSTVAALLFAALLCQIAHAQLVYTARFPFKLPTAPPGYEGAKLFTTRSDFERHCYGFIYASVGDPTKTDEQRFSAQVLALCNVSAKEQHRCGVWAADLWSAVAAKLSGRQRQAGQAETKSSVHGARSYSEWCDKVFDQQKQPSTQPSLPTTEVNNWGRAVTKLHLKVLASTVPATLKTTKKSARNIASKPAMHLKPTALKPVVAADALAVKAVAKKDVVVKPPEVKLVAAKPVAAKPATATFQPETRKPPAVKSAASKTAVDKPIDVVQGKRFTKESTVVKPVMRQSVEKMVEAKHKVVPVHAEKPSPQKVVASKPVATPPATKEVVVTKPAAAVVAREGASVPGASLPAKKAEMLSADPPPRRLVAKAQRLRHHRPESTEAEEEAALTTLREPVEGKDCFCVHREGHEACHCA